MQKLRALFYCFLKKSINWQKFKQNIKGSTKKLHRSPNGGTLLLLVLNLQASQTKRMLTIGQHPGVVQNALAHRTCQTVAESRQ